MRRGSSNNSLLAIMKTTAILLLALMTTTSATSDPEVEAVGRAADEEEDYSIAEDGAFEGLDEELLVSGPVRRDPEDGEVGSVSYSTSIGCSNDDDNDEFKWFRLRRRNGGQDETEGLNVTGPTLALGKLGLAGEGVQRIRCAAGKNDNVFADFRVNFGNESAKAFRVKNFPKSFNVVNLDDLKVFCEVQNRSNLKPLEEVKRQVGFRWYKWSTANDDSFAPVDAEDTSSTSSSSSSTNCTVESMEGSQWIEIEGAEIIPGEPEPHIKLLARDDMQNSVIKIEDATEDDRRGYKCVVYNLTRPEECDSSVFFVRVKDKYAALWPFLGIVAEVVVLCIVIFICERRRSAKVPQDDDDGAEGEEGDAYNGSNGQTAAANSDVRQRRT